MKQIAIFLKYSRKVSFCIENAQVEILCIILKPLVYLLGYL